MEKMRAFTLIELLIVVAIIAILAAIAVPNFLEAQVRSKVSRVKSDMRSLATAVESYAVDWNVIMGTNDYQKLFPALSQQEARIMAYSKLTSPVAFITTIPRDPFRIGHGGTGGSRELEEFQFNASNSSNTGSWSLPQQRGYKWVFASHGPALKRSGPTIKSTLRGQSVVAITYIYDPTNGTKSEGHLFRTNKGVGFVDELPEV